MNVLITRAEPAASQTADQLEHNGFNPVVHPLFELTDTGNPIPEKNYTGTIFTSANAVRVLDHRGWRNRNSEHVACCVGETTRKAAEKLGISRFILASGGGEALVELIRQQRGTQAEEFLYPTTPNRSFDMANALEGTGHRVTTAEVYEVLKRRPATDTFAEKLSQCKNGAVLVYSERSGGHLRDILQCLEGTNLLKSVSVIGISHSSINMLLDLPWRNTYVADHPDEKAMIHLLKGMVDHRGERS